MTPSASIKIIIIIIIIIFNFFMYVCALIEWVNPNQTKPNSLTTSKWESSSWLQKIESIRMTSSIHLTKFTFSMQKIVLSKYYVYVSCLLSKPL